MSFAPGRKLGPYEIVAPIGKGGMGEVYRARDTKLDRDVAIKVLPEEFAQDDERLARFEREAKLLASLNHPNIASIYGFESGALVLELVDGTTLAERIDEGAIPVDDAIAIAKQIAEALEAGHEAGVIHRDLKPANIKLKKDGTVKVLDYGLAKALEGDAAGRGDSELSQSPTLTRQGTQIGVILGTAAYMSPEQAKGKSVDERTDIWAYGVVVFEMLTGRQVFRGDDVSSTLAKVIEREPDWTWLPEETPPSVQRLLRRSLRKDRHRRIPDIGIARLELDDALSGAEEPAAAATADATPRAFWQRLAPAASALVLALVVGGLAGWSLTRPDPPLIVRMTIPLGEGESFTSRGRSVAISPDGRRVVYAANGDLILRAVDQLTAMPIVEAGRTSRSPFFSPDGAWIGYRQGEQLRRIAVSGGAPVTLSEVNPSHGASWGEDDTILFGRGLDGIWQVGGAGGTPERLIAVEEGELAHGPQFLPGGEWVLFTLRPPATVVWDEAQIVVQSTATGERRVVIDRGQDARYLPTGHLVYASRGVLMAVLFDPVVPEVRGGPVPVVEGVRHSSGAGANGEVDFSVARTGSMVYIASAGTGGELELNWMDRDGQTEPVGAEPGSYGWARVSPDGTRVAVQMLGDDNTDVWIYNLDRGTLTRLTFDEAFDGFPLWSSDGAHIVFQSSRGTGGLFWKAANGTGEVEQLIEHSDSPVPYAWTADGRLVFEVRPGGIGVVNLEGDRAPEIVLAGAANPTLSPDGRWIAYVSTEGRLQVFVRPFPNVEDGRWQVSRDHGFDPLWSPSGRELFFNAGGVLMVARVETEPTFSAGRPERTLVAPGTPVTGKEFDITPDGERFLVLSAPAQSSAESVVFVQHWFEELKRLVPTED